MSASDAASVDPQRAKAGSSRLEDRVNYDELTGHFTRSRLREAVDRTIAAALRRPDPAVFLALGVDNMATINEKFGAAAADTVLIAVVRRLDDCLRVSDLVGAAERRSLRHFAAALPPTTMSRSPPRRSWGRCAPRRSSPAAARFPRPRRSAPRRSAITVQPPTTSLPAPRRRLSRPHAPAATATSPYRSADDLRESERRYARRSARGCRRRCAKAA